MELRNLLNAPFNCSCGKIHDSQLRAYRYEPDAAGMLGKIIKSQNPAAQHIALVADTRTYEIAGKSAADILTKSGLSIDTVIIPDENGHSPTCDEQTVEKLKTRLKELTPDIVLAVGSGVVNDLCKWSSFDLGLKYLVFATAPSMNGYAAANVAAKIDGLKVIQRAAPPFAVLADPAIIENAPAEMIAAGFGDAIAKTVSAADWKINNFVFGEYYCDFCANMITGLEPLYLDNPSKIKHREPAAIKALFDALFYSGVAMTLVGTSFPASGAEHLFSHTLDMISDLDQKPHDLHGRQVGLGTLYASALYHKILEIDTPQIVQPPKTIDRAFWGNETQSNAIAEQYKNKLSALEKLAIALADKQIFAKIKQIIKSAVRPPETIKNWLVESASAATLNDIGLTFSRALQAADHAYEIRTRTTAIDLALLLGIYPAANSEIITKWLTLL
ncbi:MAG: iron-containing alcohol dehydrogenase [Phycisphaerae bacterium]|nr:iron-containing alcohol dehydrogenase [Phycisphaerae bacterium]